MSSSRSVHALPIFQLIFSISCVCLSYCTGNKGITCPENEKQALLSFKNSVEIPSSSNNFLHSWSNQVDCCTWDGVICSNLTSHVHELHLQSSSENSGLRGNLNPSLLNLEHLTYLNLSNNYFQSTIPVFIGSFAKLEYLDLSGNRFYGTIPHTLGNISSLRTLNLQQYLQQPFGNSSLSVESLEWLSGLPHLEHLDMSYVNLSKVTNWPQVINTLPSLLELNFRSCGLEVLSSLPGVNFTSLVFLDLSQNNFHQSTVLRWIFQLNKLIHLNLYFNGFEGSIPSISNITKLQYLDLSYNRFNSTVPDWIYRNKPLEFFDSSENALQGSISNAIRNLTSLSYINLAGNELSGEIPIVISKMCKLKHLVFSDNNLRGNISEAFGELKRLQALDLKNNLFTGPIPNTLGKLLLLEYLRLDANRFTGNLPESLGQLLNLEEVFVGDNMLEGVVTEHHFAKLTKLTAFSASRNHLSLEVDSNWIPPFLLNDLGLGSWNISADTHVPTWLDTQQKNLTSLDLSNTGISHQVPNWFWKTGFLNLSHNQLHGSIPDISGLQYVYLSYNKFNGSLPNVGNTVHELDLSNNLISGDIDHFFCGATNVTYMLFVLHLGGNMLSGEFPNCWTKFPYLKYFNIGGNNISGGIPNSIGLLMDLRSLNLYNNSLSGQIPFSIQNCYSLIKIDLAHNSFEGSIPAWNGSSLSDLRILILRSNKLNGNIPSSICHLNSLQILDLSNNRLSGEMPRCFDNFTAMTSDRLLMKYRNWEFIYSSFDGIDNFLESASIATKGTMLDYDTTLTLVTNIDLSRNKLSGEIPKQLTSLIALRSLSLSMNQLEGAIPKDIGKMRQLESLDLSRNSFSGEIPNSIAGLTFLNFLDFSFNDLIGRIPESTQLQRQDASAFIGNKLCGPPLTVKCNSGGGTSDPGYQSDNKRSFLSNVDWFYVLLSLGYAVGFSVVCTTLVLKKSWRDACFQALEDMWNKIYVYACTKLSK